MTRPWLMIFAALCLGAVLALGITRAVVAVSHAIACDGPTTQLFTPCQEGQQ